MLKNTSLKHFKHKSKSNILFSFYYIPFYPYCELGYAPVTPFHFEIFYSIQIRQSAEILFAVIAENFY